VSDHVSHPYKTTDKIIILYILIFIYNHYKSDCQYTHQNNSASIGTVCPRSTPKKDPYCTVMIRCRRALKFTQCVLQTVPRY
jgi:hypothetical protein